MRHMRSVQINLRYAPVRLHLQHRQPSQSLLQRDATRQLDPLLQLLNFIGSHKIVLTVLTPAIANMQPFRASNGDWQAHRLVRVAECPHGKSVSFIRGRLSRPVEDVRETVLNLFYGQAGNESAEVIFVQGKQRVRLRLFRRQRCSHGHVHPEHPWLAPCPRLR